MKKEEIYLDLSKLSSEQIKNVGKVLEDNNESVYYKTLIDLKKGNNNDEYNNLYFDSNDFFLFWGQVTNDLDELKSRTEITYNEFLSLFEKESLVGRKVKALIDYQSWVTKNCIYKIVDENELNIFIIDNENEENSFLKSGIGEWFELLQIEEWQPKQGEKVLVSNDSSNWSERIFVVKNKDKYFCEHNDSTTELYLYGWNLIKPFKEDLPKYLINENGIKKVKNEHQYKALIKRDWKKITNPQLIELLENEIK